MATPISQPSVTMNIAAASVSAQNAAQRVLFVGQKTASGSAVSGDLVTDLGVGDAQFATLFGENSMLATMLRDARSINQESSFDAIALDDDGAAVAATADIVFAGPATADGMLVFTIGSAQSSYSIAVLNGDTADAIAAKLDTAVNANTTAPVTSTVLADTVTLEAVNAGPEGNSIGVVVSGTVAGVTVTLNAMAGGATAPDLTNLFDVVGVTRYQTVVWPYSYGLTDIKGFLDPRFNATNRVQDGVAITTAVDTFDNLIAVGDAQNSASLVIKASKLIDLATWKGPDIMELTTSRSAMTAALRSLRLTEGANISRYNIGGGLDDNVGGVAIASLPYFNSQYPDLAVSPTNLGFDSFEVEQLLDSGISVDGANPAQNAIISGEVVTTYKTDSAGNPDPSFTLLAYVDTISAVREYFWTSLRKDFAQSRLTLGDLVAGRSMANEISVRAAMTSYYTALAEDALVEAGSVAVTFFKDNLSVTIDKSIGRVTINCKVIIVTQLREIVGTVQLAFDAQ